MIKIEVKRATNETGINLLRRFNKRLQSAGNLKLVKSLRYKNRKQSALKKKQSALKRLEKIATINRLKKLGKIRDVSHK